MMASAANVAPPMNSPSSNASASGSSQKDGPSRPVKQNSGPRMTQKGRKESPSDSNRQSATPKAWSGTNPITQRATTPNQPKGPPGPNKPTPSRMTNARDQSLSDKHSYDRLRFLFGGSIGLQVVLTTTSGDKYEGVFAGYASAQNASKITLKMTKTVPNTPITQPNGMSSGEAAFAGSSPDHALTFDLKDMADMTIPEFSLPQTSRQTNGASSSFQTDADISGSANRGERPLQKWVPDAADTTNFTLESGSAADWDQFATHERMTGGQSTYTEEQYTTAINRNAPDYKRREAEAARIAREIESEQSSNAHVREERGQAVENDFGGDEEDKYSGVRRDLLPLPSGSANRYTPPALRAPSGQATISGAPVDPAIISSQIARPDAPRASASNQTVPTEKTNTQARAVSMMQPPQGEPAPIERSPDLSKLTANGTTGRAAQGKQLAAPSPQRQPDTESASQGVENKVLDQFRQFANAERARLAEKKRVQASQDRTAKINDLIRFSKNFKLKTPVPSDLVGILAKDPKKQEAIIEKAKKDYEEAKTTTPAAATPSPSSSTAQQPPTKPFDKSMIPPPIPERNTFSAGRGTYAKQSLGRGARPLGQQLPFTGAPVPVAPRGQSAKNGQMPAPIPLPELKNNQPASGLSSPRGTDTPTSAVSSKFNVRAMEFRPTAPSFNPSTASVSAASPSPIARTASVARTSSPSSFFGQRKPKKPSERLDMMKKFNPVPRMQDEVKAEVAKKTDPPARDFKSNGGIPNAFHTQPIWMVAEENQEKPWDESFNRPPSASPAPHRHAAPFPGQMQPMMGMPLMQQGLGPQHGHHAGHHFQQTFDDQRMHMQNGTPQVFTPNMTPRSQFVSPMSHHAQPVYGQQAYFMGNRNMPMQGYVGNPAMMHGQHGQMVAPMMVSQHSSGPYMNMQNQPGMMYSPAPAHVYPQHIPNGYPSPGRQMQAPAMMHQNSQQSYHGGPQMMYPTGGPQYGQQAQMRGGYAGGHTPYGTSPHQPHAMNQRAMSSGYMQKVMPQMAANGGPPANAPQQPAAFGQMPVSEEAK